MAKLLKLRRGTTSQHSSFTGAEGEVTVDTDKDVLVVNDGSTAGGHPLAAEDMSNVSAANIKGRLGTTLTNAEINASAAIAGTKISPNFGSQNIVTTGSLDCNTITNKGTTHPQLIIKDTDSSGVGALAGFSLRDSANTEYARLGLLSTSNNQLYLGTTVDAPTVIQHNSNAKLITSSTGVSITGAITSTGNITVSNTQPEIFLQDTDNNSDFKIQNVNGVFKILDATGNNGRFNIASDGTATFTQNLNANAGLDVTGAITSTGNMTITNDAPKIHLTDSSNNPDFSIQNANGAFVIFDDTNSASRLEVNSDGHVDVKGNLDCEGGVDVTGAIAATGAITGASCNVTGALGCNGQLSVVSTAPEIFMTDTNANSDFSIVVNSGQWRVRDETNSANRLAINSDGHVDIYGNVDFDSGIDVTGNITVTGTVDGRDVAADGTKLDTIETNATADQTASEIVALIASQTIAPNNINSTNLYATDKVGRDASDYIGWANNSHMDVYVNGNNEFRFEADGDFHADGDVIAYSTTVASDENLKKDIVTVSDGLAKVEALKGVTFTWKKNDNKSAGVIAQDVQKVLPDIVREVADFDGSKHLAVNYHGLTSILIEAVKELSAKVKALEAK